MPEPSEKDVISTDTLSLCGRVLPFILCEAHIGPYKAVDVAVDRLPLALRVRLYGLFLALGDDNAETTFHIIPNLSPK